MKRCQHGVSEASGLSMWGMHEVPEAPQDHKPHRALLESPVSCQRVNPIILVLWVSLARQALGAVYNCQTTMQAAMVRPTTQQGVVTAVLSHM